MSDRTNILAKLNIVYILLMAFGFLIIGKIIYYQFFYDKEIINNALKTTRIYTSIEPIRGDIYSNDGKLLATSVAYFEAGIDLNCDAITQKIFDYNIDSLTLCLGQLFDDKTTEEYKSEMIDARDSGSRYYRFSYNISYSDFKKLSAFPLLRNGRIKGGFVYQKTFKREKPFGELARRTIGTVASPRRIGVGLEDAFDEFLRGVEGYTVKERIPGNLWMPVEDAQYVEPKDGLDLITTIDIGLQDVAETALESQLRKHNAEYGTVVLMEVKTGKVKAIANLKKHPEGFYYEELNFAVGNASDPGSTFKLASLIVAIEDGYVKPEQMVETGDGTIVYYKKKMKDSREGGYGKISLQRVFEVSSNVGISKVIRDAYKDKQSQFVEGLRKLNLDKPLGVTIKGEAIPVIHKPGDAEWSGLSLTQMSIGYELQITPLQMLAFYNAIANNGIMVKPIFAEALTYRGELVKVFEPEVINPQLCSQTTIAIVKPMLEGVVENGTAINIRSENYKIAGKTGTAQINYGNDTLPTEYHASFVGYFPADAPEYSCIVSIYKPRRNGFYGNIVAGPVFKEIADKVYATNPKFHRFTSNFTVAQTIPYAKNGNKVETEKVFNWLQIITNYNHVGQTEWVKPSIDGHKIKYNPINYSDKTKVPNVINMGLKDALVILETYGLKPIVKGRGKVVRQSPAPNSSFNKNDQITITLK
ncbi:MAG: penicillin-binding protein [Bacteroidales bacterium]|nr:penicillin-binding protein [Bacteroidales bacterium]MDD4215764.1 penicillin-binding protein [Bacteroidales bacterium]MDY0140371.1 penicillin-binding protein [Bacteroidales bacterium]